MLHATKTIEKSAQMPIFDRIALDYEARFLRRKTLSTQNGYEVLVDLPKVTALQHGDLLHTSAGAVEILAASEPVMIITGDLTRLAWHIGNRHTPCQITPFALIIRQDHVLREMLIGLGAKIRDANQSFTPEGGAYGPAQTMGHSHGHSHSHGTHAHSHG